MILECFDSSQNTDGRPYSPGVMCGAPIRKGAINGAWATCPRCGCGWAVSALKAWMNGPARRALGMAASR